MIGYVKWAVLAICVILVVVPLLSSRSNKE
jgi:hypothetical protein